MVQKNLSGIFREQKTVIMYEKDIFLTEIIQKPAYKIIDNTQIYNKLSKDNSYFFAYAKIESTDIENLLKLQKIGFQVLDTNILFTKILKEKEIKLSLPEGYQIRFTVPRDEYDVRRLAFNSFSLTRFHLDPKISNDTANNIKANWVGNYYSRKRGDKLIVTTFHNKVVGFLLLIIHEDIMIIDLIAVASMHTRKGIASSMINYSINYSLDKIKRIKVGTQIANKQSINMYEKLGFKIDETSYVLHYHK